MSHCVKMKFVQLDGNILEGIAKASRKLSPMLLQVFGGGQELDGGFDAFALVGEEDGLERILGVVFPQGWGEDEPQFFIERDKVAVERSIEGGR